MDDDAILATLRPPAGLHERLMAELKAQDDARGEWESPRNADQPDPPWPSRSSVVLEFLIWRAQASIEAGMTLRSAIVHLAVHAWFEGGIDGYDRGRQEAATKLRIVD